MAGVGKDETTKEDACSTLAPDGRRLVRLPVIDLAGIFSDDLVANCSREDARARVGKDLQRAVSEWGAFVIINHGIEEEVMEQLFQNIRQFMALPQETKDSYTHSSDLLANGYARNDYYKHDAPVTDEKHIEALRYQLAPSDLWPHNLPSLRDSSVRMGKEAARLIELVLELMCENLGLASSAIKEALENEYLMSNRIIMYHPVSADSKDGRVSLPAHTDWDIMTCIVQAGDPLHPAVQLLKNDTQEWFSMDPALPSTALTFYVGDMLETLTNGAYKSGVHRVLANDKTSRIVSVYPYFPLNRSVAPLPQLIDDQHPKLYRPFNLKERHERYLSPGVPLVDKAWLRVDPLVAVNN